MPFVVGELFVPSVTRWCGEIIGPVQTSAAAPVLVPGQWRALLLAPTPTMITMYDVDLGVTAFALNTFVAAPSGQPPVGSFVRIQPNPLFFQGITGLTANLPDPDLVGQVWFYANLGGPNPFAAVVFFDGSTFLALPGEMALARPTAP